MPADAPPRPPPIYALLGRVAAAVRGGLRALVVRAGGRGAVPVARDRTPGHRRWPTAGRAADRQRARTTRGGPRARRRDPAAGAAGAGGHRGTAGRTGGHVAAAAAG